MHDPPRTRAYLHPIHRTAPALSVYFLYEPIGNLIIVRASGCQPASFREASIQLLPPTLSNLARQKLDCTQVWILVHLMKKVNKNF